MRPVLRALPGSLRRGFGRTCSRRRSGAANATTWSAQFGRKFSGFEREPQFVVELSVAGIVVGEVQVIVASGECGSVATSGVEARD